MIVLPQNEKSTDELKALAPIATAKARIYVDCMGQEANSGSVNFASRSFNVIWVGDKILAVSAMEYGKCAKCMMETFEGAGITPKNGSVLPFYFFTVSVGLCN